MEARNRAAMTVCGLCGGEVWTERLIEHWRDSCPKTRPQPSLLDTTWSQIDEIVEREGGRNLLRDPREGYWR